MLAERMIIETDLSGKPKNLPSLPPNATVEIICLILDAPFCIASTDNQPSANGQTAQPKRRPSPKLADTVILGDIMEPLLTEEQWEASFERTCRQIEGDPEAFK